MLPAYFIAHGSPTLAIENNEYSQFLKTLSQTIPQPKAVVCFSAHWVATIQTVSKVEQFETIHDFYGFPDEMFKIEYPAKGDLNLSEEIQNLLTSKGITFEINKNRGLDHGAWVVLRLLYPNADIPVVSMSVNPNATPEQQYEIGKALAPLRGKDVLIIGSGGTVHNLRALNWRSPGGPADQWAVDFDDWIASRLANWDVDSLFQYESLAPNVNLAVPQNGNEHFIPLFYAMGTADNEKIAKFIHRSYQYGNLSHSVWQFG